jgi:hypothetical protein
MRITGKNCWRLLKRTALKREGRQAFPTERFWKELVPPLGFPRRFVFEEVGCAGRASKLFTDRGQLFQIRSPFTNVVGGFPIEFYLVQYARTLATLQPIPWELQLTAKGRVSA